MNKNYINTLSFALLFLFASGCYQDLGNYEYNEINEIGFGGFLEEGQSYTLRVGENFRLEPDLILTMDNSFDPENYEYEWFAHGKGNLLPGDVEKFLSNERILDINVTLPPNSYDGYFRVKDKKTGIKFTKKFEFQVITSIYEGWLALCDVEGKARLDMVSFIEDDTRVINDVLGFTGSSLSLEGNPVETFTYRYHPQQYGIYVTTTGNGTTKIDPETFDWDDTQRLSFEMIANAPLDFSAKAMYRNGANSSYIIGEDDNLYYYLRIFNIRYSVPINKLNTETQNFKISPYISTGNDWSTHTILFDEDNKRFVRHVGSNILESAPLPEGTLFDYQIGKDLVYMSYTPYNGGETVAVLSDQNSGKFYLARMTQTRNNNIVQTYFQEIAAPNFHLAKNISFHPSLGYLFYSIGNKVYEYDMFAKTAIEMLDFGNREISLLKFEQFEVLRPYNAEIPHQLIVSTYDNATENSGTIEFYNVPPVNGPLTLSNKYEGLGKIISLSYRER
ncbi:PKD-like family lipoprotein [Belliella marina]|uniref:PKD-like family lipoprotein n=1 Tax=Belliella marina TaxID=1644146 RepID=A0ABW4VR31_9BACT